MKLSRGNYLWEAFLVTVQGGERRSKVYKYKMNRYGKRRSILR